MTPLEEKQAFFDQLKTQFSDDEFDDAYLQERQRRRRFFQQVPAPAQPVPNTASEQSTAAQRSTPRRIVSAPTPKKSKASTQVVKGTPVSAFERRGRLPGGLTSNADSPDIIIVDDTPIPETEKPVPRGGIKRSDSTPLLPSKRLLGLTREDSVSPSITMKKRKREPPLKIRPEDEQIFKGLAFYYVPDNDIAPARRLRIAKAREYGATWTRSTVMATHFVVDKNIAYKDLAGVLAASNRRSPPKVVNEDYAIDCIQFKALLQHDQKKYQLMGQPVTKEAESSVAAPTSSEEPVRSLQLKPPPKNTKRWDYIPPQGTPARSEGSPEPARTKRTPNPTDSQPVILDLDQLLSSGQGVNLSPRRQSCILDADKIPATNDANEGDNAPKDALSEYITIMQKYKDLPLDAEEDEDGHSVVDLSGASSDVNEASGSEDERRRDKRPAHKKTRVRRKDLASEDKFACNSAGTKIAGAGNPNARTIEILQQMADYYDRVDDHWRTTAYRRAISTLKRQTTKITTEDEACRLPSIGLRLAQKIAEIVTTNKLQRLQYAQDDPMSESLQLFLGIYGVGTSLAQQWIAQGFRTLDDLRERAKLTPNQLVGVEHYDDLNTRIPRREVEALGAVVRRAAEELDPSVELIIGGSYRRGAETSGDIDFIVTKPDTETSGDLREFLDTLVAKLEAEQFLVARLASSRPGDEGGSKWHGCCVLPPPRMQGVNNAEGGYRAVWRRIDFLLVPATEMGAALIYFTGNDIFNRSLRLLASKKGMRLNQRGLYKDVMRGPQRVKVTQGELVEGRDERRIFDILGVKWREPHERWC